MMVRLRVLFLLAHPLVMVLLAVYAALGLAQAGHGQDVVSLVKVLAVIAGFLLFSVVCNDIADEAVDRINLPDDMRRPLVSGAAGRRDLVVVGGVSAAVAIVASALLHWSATVVLVVGMALSAGYSLRPVRIADRGAVASLVLPACYVAVPYLVGLMAARGGVTARDLGLLAGLYVGFIGRILLKDFRDVRGDALFGKRTFLIRHGRGWTCVFNSICWVVGTIAVIAVLTDRPSGLVVIYAAGLLAVLVLLRALSRDAGPKRDEAIIAAIAITGRGMALILLAHLTMITTQWSPAAHLTVLVALAVLTAGQATTMIKNGPVGRLTVPTSFDPVEQPVT
jgi:4-hydroxybenzoate polyprenyltransferase